MSYFMFTSLSTVGLGDYHPISNKERVLGATILLFGVLLTSFVMENFINMIRQIRQVNGSFEESNKLSLFLTTLRKFNSYSPLPLNQQKELE